MPPKNKTIYVCSQCGFEMPKWAGKCPSCGEWNTVQEEMRMPERNSPLASGRPGAYAVRPIGDICPEGEHRHLTGLPELDRVLGGGIVQGSLTLVGGDPGIGKSTLLLQVCHNSVSYTHLWRDPADWCHHHCGIPQVY